MNVEGLLNEAWPGWRIVREIGSGSQGSVFQIVFQSPMSNEPVYRAVKVTELTQIREEADKRIDPFREEALMWRFSGYPNIVQILDSAIIRDSDTQTRYLLLMQELLLPLEEYKGFDLYGIGRDICAALSVLHQNGICHLDVKPGNIFVTPDGTFKLGDFGTARSRTELGQGIFSAGTRHYTAPELLDSHMKLLDPTAATKADIFSLGMVLLEISIWEQYGREWHGPDDDFQERTDWFGSQRHHAGYYAIPEKCIEDVIRHAINEDPAKRYQTSDEMREKLIAVANCGGVSDRSRMRQKYIPSQEPDVMNSYQQFIHADVRSLLTLLFPSGMHCTKTACPYDDKALTRIVQNGCDYHTYVGTLSGVQIAYYNHKPPVAVSINGKKLRFRPTCGLIEIRFDSLFKERAVPCDIDIVVDYEDGLQYRWYFTQKQPERHWGWFKLPDWT